MSIWSSLAFQSMDIGLSAASTYRQANTFRKSGEMVQYRNNRPKSIHVQMAKSILLRTIKYETEKKMRQWMNALFKKKQAINQALEDNKARRKALIEHREVQDTEGSRLEIKCKDGSKVLIAPHDQNGRYVPEGMILYYDTDNKDEWYEFEDMTFSVNTETKQMEKNLDGDRYRSQSKSTHTFFHVDAAPDIHLQSTKNIVTTTVQGRDYSRKELVSGGDLEFSVNGSIVSYESGIYPKESVKKFVKMMQYNGIINVKSFQFNQYNVDRIIIKDFKLDQPTYMNVQPYSFTCVAIEPDEEIKVAKDTIAQINELIQSEAPTQSVNYLAILKEKAIQITKDLAVNTATDAMVEGTSMGLDAITKWNRI